MADVLSGQVGAAPRTAAHQVPRQRSPGALPSFATPSWQRRLVLALLLVDTCAVSVASLLALLIGPGHSGSAVDGLLTLALPVGLVAMIALSRGYEGRFLGSGSEEFRRVADAALRYLALAATAAYMLSYELARGYVVLAFPLAIALLLCGRCAARQAVVRARRRGQCAHKVLVVGRERSAAELIRQLRRGSSAGFDVVGACLDGSTAQSVEGVPVLGGASGGVLGCLRASGADTVAVSAWSPLSQQDVRRLAWELEGTGASLVVAPCLTDVAGPRLHIRPVAGLPLLHVQQPEFRGARRLAKGLLDRSVALLALVVLLPVLLGLAVAVRATSEGPALFRQSRVGRAGSTFTMYKFRSMTVTAERDLAALLEQNEAADGVLFKMRRDPRVTTVGEWLRRFSLDELPQLLNVVRGEMSLVGPRPPLATEVARYGHDVHRRLLVKPGVTGLWQISGRSDLSWEESVRLDLHYVENWSLALDLAILWRTAGAVLQRRGAY